MQLPGAQAAPWAGDVPNGPQTKKSASCDYEHDDCLPAEPGASKPTCATEEAAEGFSQMGQQEHQDDYNQPVKMSNCAKVELCSSTWASKIFAEKLHRFCVANGPAKHHKVRQKLGLHVFRTITPFVTPFVPGQGPTTARRCSYIVAHKWSNHAELETSCIFHMIGYVV